MVTDGSEQSSSLDTLNALSTETVDDSKETEESTAEVAKSTEESTEDWRTLYEELRGKTDGIEKRENDLRSREGNVRKQEDRDVQLQELGDGLTGVTKILGAVLNAQAESNPELQAVSEEVAQQAQAQNVRRQQRNMAVSHDALVNGIKEDAEAAGIDLGADDFRPLLTEWETAKKSYIDPDDADAFGDITSLILLQSKFRSFIREKGATAVAITRKAAEKAATEAKNAALKEAGVNDMDLGDAAGGTASNSWRGLTPTQKIQHELDRRAAEAK